MNFIFLFHAACYMFRDFMELKELEKNILEQKEAITKVMDCL